MGIKLTETKIPARKEVWSLISIRAQRNAGRIRGKGRVEGNEKRTKRIRATTRCDFTRDRESTKDEKKLGSL